MKIPNAYNAASIVIILLLITACTSTNAPTGTPAKTAAAQETATNEIIQYLGSVGKTVASSIPESAYWSDYVVFGRAQPTNTFVNGARRMKDCTHPSEYLLAVGHVYEISVDRYIKGDGPEKLLVIVNEIDIDLYSNPSPQPEQIERFRLDQEGKSWKPLRPDHPYLMFIGRMDKAYDYRDCVIDGYDIRRLHFGAGFPWVFDIENQDAVIPEDIYGESHSLDSLLLYHPARSMDEILQLIHEPYSPPPTEIYQTPEPLPTPYLPPVSLPENTPDPAYPGPLLYPGP